MLLMLDTFQPVADWLDRLLQRVEVYLHKDQAIEHVSTVFLFYLAIITL